MLTAAVTAVNLLRLLHIGFPDTTLSIRFHVKLRIYNTYYVPGSRYRYRLQYVEFSAPGV